MKKYIFFVIPVLACIFLRLIPHAPNIAPLTAFAIFAGYAYGWRKALIITPLIALITDFFLGFYEWQIMTAVYVSYGLIALFGFLIRSNQNAIRTVLATWTGSFIFFVVTNGAVWLFSAWYPKTASGLMAAYGNGLPFLRNSLIGDMAYGALFYVGYVLYRARAPVRKNIQQEDVSIYNSTTIHSL